MMQNSINILLVEDDPEDSYLIGEAFDESRVPHQLVTVTDGDELLDFLKHRNKFANQEGWTLPDIIVLDLNMPRKDGRESLQEIKADPALKRIPVVVFTNSRDEEDIIRCYDLGIAGYITKPVSFMGLLSAIQSFCSYWLQAVTLPPK